MDTERPDGDRPADDDRGEQTWLPSDDWLGATLADADTVDLGTELEKSTVRERLFGKPAMPTRIGRFLLIERIGVGAMGEVFTAFDPQLERKVALKLVRKEVSRSHEAASKRLVREAQTLARLSHPNVVQVYEAGVFSGRVFLAMEFIQGQTLRKWLAQSQPGQRRPWRAVLAHFVAAGRGLEAAHAAGLTHRDFKPDNVLVGNDGRVRVADFGLAGESIGEATETDADRTHPTTLSDVPVFDRLTATGTVMGTPAYMSPEQMEGGSTDGRSDQYSFCVSLYEALSGGRPYEADTLSELREKVREEVTLPQDTRVPRAIWRVISRGLAGDPEKRYPTMDELLRALSRAAARRGRLWLAAAALAAVAVLSLGLLVHATATGARAPCAGAGDSTRELWSAAAQGRLEAAFRATNLSYADRTWQRAKGPLDRYTEELAAEQKATCVATRVRHEQSEELFVAKTACLAVRQMHLAAALEQFESADSSVVDESMRVILTLPAVDGCRDAQTLLREAEPPGAAIADRVNEIRAQLAEADVQQLLGRLDDARARTRESLRQARELGYTPVHAQALFRLGVIEIDDDSAEAVKDAETHLLTAAELAEKSRHDRLAADIWSELALLAGAHHDDPTRGHDWARLALAKSERLGDDMRKSRALSRLGRIYFREDRLAEAEEVQRRALDLAHEAGEQLLFEADGWQDLANTLVRRSRFGEARRAFARAFESLQGQLGENHPRVARLRRDIAIFLRECGEFDEARAELEAARAIWVSIRGAEYLEVAHIDRVLANLEQQVGNLERARKRALSALAIYRKVRDPEDRSIAAMQTLLGIIHVRERRYVEAEERFRQALGIQERVLGDDHIDTIITRNNIAETLVGRGLHDEALQMADEVAQRLRAAGNEHPVIAALPHKSRGLALLGKGDARAARASLEEALSLLQQHPGYPLEKADVKWALARALRTAGESPGGRSEALAFSAREVYLDQGPAGRRMVAEIDAWMGASRARNTPRGE